MKNKIFQKLAKLTPPLLPKVVERMRLYRQLDQMHRQQPIVWIVGAPGMGKTTLVNSYLRSRKFKPLWYQLDAGDQDPATFFHYLRLAFQYYAPRSGLALPHLTAEYLGGLPVFVRRFFERMLSDRYAPRVLVFDNYQDLPQSSAIQELLPIGMEVLPPDVAVIVISREQPPEEWVRLRANQHINLVLEESLRLTDKEENTFIQLHLGKAQQARFHQQRAALGIAKGWVAGLILLIEQMKLRGDLATMEVQGDTSMVFEYLAQEVLGHFPPAEQACLIKSAVFPWMTAGMVADLTGFSETQSMLEGLTRRRYFTERGPGADPTYHYHPLFRAFLQTRFEQLFSLDQRAEVLKQAGRILEQIGEPDEVVELFHQAQDFSQIIRLIQAHAPMLVGQGRQETIGKWLSYVPIEMYNDYPWLLFWKASASSIINPLGSKILFKKALHGFKTQGEGLGQILSVTGLVGTLFHTWDNLWELDDWLPELEALLIRFPGPYPIEAQAQILAARLTWAYRYHLISPQIDAWAWELLELLESIPFLSLRIVCMLPAIGWLGWRKPLKDLRAINQQLRSWTKEKTCSPSVSGSVVAMEALIRIHAGETQACIDITRDGIELCENEGLFFLSRQSIATGAWAAIAEGNHIVAEKFLEDLRSPAEDHPGVLGLYYHGLATWYWLDSKRWDKVSYHLGEMDQRSNCGAAFQEANRLLLRAHVQFELGKHQQAHKDLENGSLLANQYGIIQCQTMALFARAYFAFQKKEDTNGCEALAGGLALVRTTSIAANYAWRPSVMSMLCIKALENDIEVDQAREIIRKYCYRPVSPPYTLEHWPWMIKVTTLGQFRIEVNRRLVAFGRKVPRRVLALFQAIIAFGGENVREERLLDALWPEADGDRAYRSYATALHRLRKLLGDEKAIIVKDSKVTLDPYLCWVDVWAFEALLKQADAEEQECNWEKCADCREQALHLYQGPFLPDATDATWSTRFRDRLRKQYMTHVEQLCQAWTHNGKVEEARALFLRAIECEPEIESIQGALS